MEINDILTEAVKRDASDVHIVCVLPPLFRVHGNLVRISEFGDVTPDISQKILTGILNEEQKKRLLEDLSLDFSYTIPEVVIFFKCCLGEVGIFFRTSRHFSYPGANSPLGYLALYLVKNAV